MRRLRLVLATHSHLLKAEVASLQDGPHLPGRTAAHGLVYGYALDASQTPEWLVIPEGRQSGRWRLLRNSTGPGRRCRVGCSRRYQPKPDVGEHRQAQDYTFESLHRVYFYDAWRPEPVLDVPGSELVLPPQAGLLVQGCYWPQPEANDAVLSVSDAETEMADNPLQSPASPATTDATMAVSILSPPPGPSTLPRRCRLAGTPPCMGAGDGDATSSGGEGDCLSNCPSSSNIRLENPAMAAGEGEVSSALPPQGVDPSDASIRVSDQAATGDQARPLERSIQKAPLVGRHFSRHFAAGQQPVTMEDLANMAAHARVSN